MIGTTDLGLSDAEWRRLTPRLLVLRLERMREQREQREKYSPEWIRAGGIQAAIWSVNRDTKKKPDPWTWEDIYPHAAGKKPEPDPDELSQKVAAFNHFIRAMRN